MKPETCPINVGRPTAMSSARRQVAAQSLDFLSPLPGAASSQRRAILRQVEHGDATGAALPAAFVFCGVEQHGSSLGS